MIENAEYEEIKDVNQNTSIRIRPMKAEEVLATRAKSNIVTANAMVDGSMPLYPAFNNLLVRDPTTLQYANEGYSRNSLIFNILTRRAQAVHQAKLKVYKKDADGEKGDPLPYSDYQKLLDRPNPYMTARVFWQTGELYVCVGGVNFVNKVRDEYGVVKYLYPYHQSQVNYIQGSQQWIDGYVYDNGAGYRRSFTTEEMFEIKFTSVNFFYPFKAISPMLSLLKEVNVDNQRGELEVALLQNGGVPSFAIYPGDTISPMTGDQIDTAIEKIISKINGRNRGKPLLMNPNYKVEKIGYSPKDMLLTDFAKIPETRACLLPGTGIITRRGVVAIEQVVPGDYVISHKGIWRKVTESLTNPNRPCVEVQSSFASLFATEDHPVYAARISQNRGHKCNVDSFGWLGAGALKPTGIRGECNGLVIPKLRPGAKDYLEILPLIKQNRFPLKEKDGKLIGAHPGTHIIPARIPYSYQFGRLFGFYLAEGSSAGTRIEFDFNKNETEYHSEVIAALKDIFHLPAKMRECRTAMRITAQHPALAQLFKCGNAHTKMLPEWVWIATEEFWRGMLSAWSDGDGNTTKKWKRTRITTVSKNLAWHMRLIAIALGKKAGLTADHRAACYLEGRLMPEGISYVVQFQESDEPRYSKFLPHSDGLVTKVKSIKGIDYSGPVYNLEVEQDHSFLTESGVVHNCAVYGVPAGYAQTLIGLEHAGTYANRETDKRSMFEDTIVPAWGAYAEDIMAGMAGEMFHDGIKADDCIVEFDYSKLPALMESNDKVLGATVKLWMANMLPLNAALAKLGEDPLDESDPKANLYYTELTGLLGEEAPPPALVITPPAVPIPNEGEPDESETT